MVTDPLLACCSGVKCSGCAGSVLAGSGLLMAVSGFTWARAEVSGSARVAMASTASFCLIVLNMGVRIRAFLHRMKWTLIARNEKRQFTTFREEEPPESVRAARS